MSIRCGLVYARRPVKSLESLVGIREGLAAAITQTPCKILKDILESAEAIPCQLSLAELQYDSPPYAGPGALRQRLERDVALIVEPILHIIPVFARAVRSGAVDRRHGVTEAFLSERCSPDSGRVVWEAVWPGARWESLELDLGRERRRREVAHPERNGDQITQGYERLAIPHGCKQAKSSSMGGVFPVEVVSWLHWPRLGGMEAIRLENKQPSRGGCDRPAT